MSEDTEYYTEQAETSAPVPTDPQPKATVPAPESRLKKGVRKGVTTLALGGIGLLPGCRKDSATVVQGPPTTANNAIHTVNDGNVCFYYGIIGSDALKTQLNGFNYTVVEPAYTPPGMLTNGMPYLSLVGININNGGARSLQLKADIEAMDGFLKDTSGHIATSYNSGGNVYIFDSRIPAVKARLKQEIMWYATNYEKGVFFDDMDAVTYAESGSATNIPVVKYKGLTDSTLSLLGETCDAINAMPGKIALVNGGWQQSSTGVPVLNTILKHTSHIAKESYAFTTSTGNNAVAWDPSSSAWLAQRNDSAQLAAAADGVQNIDFVAIEPGTVDQVNIISPGDTVKVLPTAVDFYKNKIPAIPNVNVNTSLYIGNLTHMDSQDIGKNAANKGKQL